MKQIISAPALLLIFYLAAFAQDESKFPPVADPDVFGRMSWGDEKQRLDNFADSLTDKQDAIGFIVLKIGGQNSRMQIKSRLTRIIKYLNTAHKIKKDRFRIVIQSFTEDETKYLLIPKKEVPDCENCSIISADDKFKELERYFIKH